MHKPFRIAAYVVALLVVVLIGIFAYGSYVDFSTRRRIEAVLPAKVNAVNLTWKENHFGYGDCYGNDGRSSCPSVFMVYAYQGDLSAAAAGVRSALGMSGNSNENWKTVGRYQYRLYVSDQGNGSLEVDVQEYDLN